MGIVEFFIMLAVFAAPVAVLVAFAYFLCFIIAKSSN